MLEDAQIVVEPDEYDRGIAYLDLTGDFTNIFEKYLADEKAVTISLLLPYDVAEKLYKDLGRVL